MKAYLLIAREPSAVTKERYQEYLDAYKKYSEGFPDETKYLLKRFKKAYKYCLDKDYEHEMGKSKYPLKDNEILFLAQSVFCPDDIVHFQIGGITPTYKGYEHDEGSFIRMGIAHEVEGEYGEAFLAYNNCMSPTVTERAYYCQNIYKKQVEKYYKDGLRLYNKGNYSDCYFDLMMASDQNHKKATVLFAKVLIFGLGCPRNIEDGVNYLLNDWVGNDYYYPAAKLLTSLYDDGTLLGYVEVEDVIKRLERIEESGVAFAKKRLAKGFDKRNYLSILKEKAEKGDIVSIQKLYASENVTEEERMKYLNQASSLNDSDATYVLAELAKGDKKQELMEKAAKQGDWEADLYLGDKYLKQGDKDMAYKYYQMASKVDASEGHYKLAMLQEERKEYKEAIASYKKAADMGILPAVLKLHEIYKEGLLGESKDEKKAAHYMFLSGVGRD